MNVTSRDDATRYGSYAELPGPMLDDTMLLIGTDPDVLHGAWEVPGGYAFSSIDGYGGDPCWLNVAGSLESAPLLLDAALGELGEKCCGITVPRGLDLTKWIGSRKPNQWDAMRCDVAPPEQPDEERVARLTDLAAVQAFLERVNPHYSVHAEHPEVERWLGVADGSGALVAVGAFTRRRRGTAYLASIATAPEARGQGLGAAVTAALTRHAFASGDSLCTLAHYHPNEPARRIYLRLGYRTTHQAQSTGLIADH
ncbi:MAG TPA: GNAT family N-acetyltransferase [Actinospica sp.]|jgi:ribosomal protein S18 acetylase RimI-like enzyme|nr:GNAT family N-acetyltransferase [Actinospica sp.]